MVRRLHLVINRIASQCLSNVSSACHQLHKLIDAELLVTVFIIFIKHLDQFFERNVDFEFEHDVVELVGLQEAAVVCVGFFEQLPQLVSLVFRCKDFLFKNWEEEVFKLLVVDIVALLVFVDVADHFDCFFFIEHAANTTHCSHHLL